MKRAFIDIRWADELPVGNNVLTIAVRLCEENEEEPVLRLFRVIKPRDWEKVSKETLSGISLGRAIVREADSARKTLIEIIEKVPGADLLVFPDKTAADILKAAFRNKRIAFFKGKCVYVDELLKEVSGEKITFKEAYPQLGINIDNLKSDPNYLVIAKHSVKLLEEVYNAVSKIAGTWELGDLYSSQDSNILHMPDCRYAKQIKEEHLSTRSFDGILKGTKFCKCCGKHIFPIVRLGKPVVREKRQKEKKVAGKKLENAIASKSLLDQIEYFGEEFQELVNKNFVRYVFSNDVMYVFTSAGSWRFVPQNKSIKVLHRNLRSRKYIGSTLSLTDYHEQRRYPRDVMKALKYVISHDEWQASSFEEKITKLDTKKKRSRKGKANCNRQKKIKRSIQKQHMNAIFDYLSAERMIGSM